MVTYTEGKGRFRLLRSSFLKVIRIPELGFIYADMPTSYSSCSNLL